LIKQYHARRPMTAIKTLVLRPQTNRLSPPWTPPLALSPPPRPTNLSSPSSHLTDNNRPLTPRPGRSSRVCSDKPRSPLTSLKSSARINALTHPTRTRS
jgi:hypothetical protein